MSKTISFRLQFIRVNCEKVYYDYDDYTLGVNLLMLKIVNFVVHVYIT